MLIKFVLSAWKIVFLFLFAVNSGLERVWESVGDLNTNVKI